MATLLADILKDPVTEAQPNARQTGNGQAIFLGSGNVPAMNFDSANRGSRESDTSDFPDKAGRNLRELRGSSLELFWTWRIL